METNVVKVKLWGLDVGYVYWNSKKGVAIFEYESAFLKQGLDIAPLTMSAYSPRSQKQLPWEGDKNTLYQGLPPMIADSLPDKWGKSLFSAWIRDNKIPEKRVTPVDHLSFIGSRAMGALEYEPARIVGEDSAFSVDVQRLYEFAKQVLNDREAIVLNEKTSILWQDLVKISSSPGGKRPKAIVAINKSTGEVVSGQGKIPDGFKNYVLKYDDNTAYPYAKLEYVYYLMALDAGIVIMPSELKTYDGKSHFLTERFDRIDNNKIHTQTLAAISPTSESYEDIFTVIRRLNLPYEDSRQQFLRMVFNVLARNVDDHSKNFAFCMNHKGEWRLSPAYDLTFSVDLGGRRIIKKKTLTINSKSENITRQDLESVGLKNDIKDYKILIDKVADSVAKFENLSIGLEIDKKLISQIKAEFVKLDI